MPAVFPNWSSEELAAEAARHHRRETSDGLLLTVAEYTFEDDARAILDAEDLTTPTPLDHILMKVGQLMSTIADIQAAQHAHAAAVGKMVDLAKAQAAFIASLLTQLATAQTTGDPVAMAAVVASITASTTAIDAAVAALPPVPVPPGQPVIT